MHACAHTDALNHHQLAKHTHTVSFKDSLRVLQHVVFLHINIAERFALLTPGHERNEIPF